MRVGDLGATDTAGNQTEDVWGVCSGNHASGVCLAAYAVNGDTSYGIGITDFNMRVSLLENTGDVNSEGFNFENASFLNGRGNNVRSTNAIVRISRNCDLMDFSGNTLHCINGTDESSSGNTAINDK